jgi:hypothetical protein
MKHLGAQMIQAPASGLFVCNLKLRPGTYQYAGVRSSPTFDSTKDRTAGRTCANRICPHLSHKGRGSSWD